VASNRDLHCFEPCVWNPRELDAGVNVAPTAFLGDLTQCDSVQGGTLGGGSALRLCPADGCALLAPYPPSASSMADPAQEPSPDVAPSP
jgi:hypothetical protein